ncbi:MAG: hypothetical protein C3F07_10125 [Anaerolineales bacterium]|nr:MAG: hypothetical protein C3F07_10125 [Anaerolineales bacterium]
MTADKEKKWRFETGISIVSLLISIGTLAFTLVFNLSPGKTQPYKPSGFAIIRGVDWFESDHIVIPFEWENSGGRSVIIRHPKLILHEIDSNGNETGETITFYLAGEYQDISSASFIERYSVIRSFIIQPHTITLKTLLFHIENWWDDKGSTFSFHFTGGSIYKAYVSYEVNLDPKEPIYLFDLNVYGSTDKLMQDRTKGYWWDFWTID